MVTHKNTHTDELSSNAIERFEMEALPAEYLYATNSVRCVDVQFLPQVETATKKEGKKPKCFVWFKSENLC